ncbi:MAG: TlpA disulfide reductase family protein [Pseudomonadota bacterium]
MNRAIAAVVLGLVMPPLPGIAGTMGFAVLDAPQDMPEVRFVTEDGSRRTLADFRGKVILLNIWATWCIPCRKEMPTLDALQADLGSSKFEVVTLSIDKAGVPVVRQFFDEYAIRNLAIYVDQTSLAFSNLGVFGLPTTLIVDGDGRELARLIGPAEWNSPDMEEFLATFIN